ncbi:MAG: DUF4012 domain-containing protein [Chloroflexi bacterium]|nr:DUF4012 domain-containing protein [Chloroflexota bacterium]MCI0646782.1 DUF4012 domain-containing protein [Chloroflexota bacterium]MCI0730190.1 DUF4012 domain-containing protein [Chloroflexota bacterium]
MSESTISSPAIEAEKSIANRLPLWLVLGGLALALGWLGFKGFNTAHAAQSLLSRQAEIEALMAEGVANADPDQTEALVVAIRGDIARLKSNAAPFVAVAPLFGWLPKVGPLLDATPELMTMADAGSEAAAYAMRGLKPALVLLQQPGEPGVSQLPVLLQVVDAAGPDLVQAAAAMDRVMAARAAITNVEGLPWRVRTLLEAADDNLPIARNGLKLAQVLPEIMGSQGRRTYLIVAQNEDELRATGGFISGAGLIVVENGAILSVNFGDPYLIDNWAHKPYDFPPQPLYDFMGSELFLFRDANYWPDFPTSAEKVMQLYTYGQNVPLDGAIGIDQRFLQLLLTSTGPVQVPELEATISSENVIAQLRAEWGPQPDQTGNWVVQRKAFMGPLASAIRARLEMGLATLDPIHLARTIQAAVDTGHLQIYLRDPAVAAIMAETGWDGRLANPAGQDFLLVVDTSVGFNKASVAIERQLTYQVTLTGTGGGQADLAVQYNHPINPDGQPCRQGATYTGATRYEDLINGCYWDYVRIYTPAGSTLLEASSHPLEAGVLLTGLAWDGQAQVVTDDPGPMSVFANFLLVPRGESVTTSFRYQLPAGVVQPLGGRQQYTLTVAKQAGARPQLLQVTVVLPPGARLAQTIPAADSVNGQTVLFSAELDQDRSFTVIYR